tara:strand:+ start:111 stop:371 length:261 start_codon:yes stop_codon:yes gene_type:complete
MPASKSLRTKIIATYQNLNRGKRLAKVPALSQDQQEQAIDEFMKAGKAKRYPYGASYILAEQGDEPSQGLIENWEYINPYIDITND